MTKPMLLNQLFLPVCT